MLVIGGGAAGLSAALAAAAQGADVVVVDENARIGGAAGYQLGNDATRRRTHAELLACVAAEITGTNSAHSRICRRIF